MADLNVSLIMRLVDRISGPAKRAADAVERSGRRMGAAGIRQLERADRMNETISRQAGALRGQTFALAASGYAFTRAMQPAIAYEKRMAEISKVVDFQDADGFKNLGRDITALVTDGGLPVAASGIMDIVAAAGRMGVVDANLPDAQKRRELIEFARNAAQMGIAFDISANDAGTSMARLMENLDLDQTGVLLVADAINLLGNTMATNEADILAVVQRYGTIASSAGLAAEETAALSASILAAGAAPEIAGTGLKNFLNALTKGGSMTDRQSQILEKLGLDAVNLAKRMQVDAKGGILSVLNALNDLEDFERNSAVGDLFGEEAKAAITPLLANVEGLRDAFAKVADQENFAGGMLEEYARQAGTTAAQVTLLKNQTTALVTVLGSQLLPMLNEGIAAIMPIVGAIADWSAANPELVSQLGWLTAGLFATTAATVALRWAFLGVYRVAALVFAAAGYLLTGLGWLTASFAGLGGAIASTGAALLASPIFWAIAAIAAGAYVIYDNWDNIGAYFEGKSQRIADAFQTNLIDGVFATIAEINPFTLAYDGTVGFIEYLIGVDVGPITSKFARIFVTTPLDHLTARARAMLAELLAMGWSGIAERIDAAFSIDLFAKGVAMIQSLRDGAFSVLTAMVRAIQAKLEGIVPSWMKGAAVWAMGGGEGGGETKAGNRALGGSVRAGSIYQVNEEGQEFFRPGVSGTMITARDARAGLGGSGGRSFQMGDIHIHAAPGMNEEALANKVVRKLRALDDNEPLHDGGAYAS